MKASASFRSAACLAASLVTLALIAPPALAWSSPHVLDGAGGTNGRVSAPIGEDTASVVFGGVPQVFYSAYVDGRFRLRHASLGNTPSFETLDGIGGSNGRTTHAVGSDVSAGVFDGVLHVFYRDDTGGNLRHAWLDDAGWHFSTLDGASTGGGRVDSDVGRSSVVSVYRKKLNVFYVDGGNADVRRATFDGTSWAFSTIDGNGATAAGRTDHAVGFTVRARVWGGSLHVFYYECDPAYACDLGWVREARLTGSSWTYQRSFRVNTIVPGKTLAVGVVSASQVYIAYNTTIQGDPRLRWRLWNGVAWSDSSLLVEELFGDVSAFALFVVLNGVPTLVFSDLGSYDTQYFTWSAGGVSSVSASFVGAPSSALVTAGSARVFWGATDTGGGSQLLVRTTQP